jgi:hypothetical protein
MHINYVDNRKGTPAKTRVREALTQACQEFWKFNPVLLSHRRRPLRSRAGK